MIIQTYTCLKFKCMLRNLSSRTFSIPILLGFCIVSSALLGIRSECNAQEGLVYVQPNATVSGLPSIAFNPTLGSVGYLEVASKPDDFDGWPPGKTTFVVFRPDGFTGDGQRMVSSAYGSLHPEQSPDSNFEVNTTMISGTGLLRAIHPRVGGRVSFNFGAAGNTSTENFWVAANVWEDNGTVHLIRMNSLGEVTGADRNGVDANPQDHLFTRIGVGSQSDGGLLQPFGGQIAAVLVFNRQLPFGPGEDFGQVMNFLFNAYMTEQGGDPDAVPVTDGLVLHLNGSNVVMDNGAVVQFTDISGRENHAQVLSSEAPLQVTWIAGDGMWNVPGNWDPEVVPRSFDEALFHNGGTTTVGGNWTLGTVDIEGGSHLIVEAGATLTTTGDDGSRRTLKIRGNGGGSLTVYGNVMAAQNSLFGQGDVANGDFATVVVDGGSIVSDGNIILTEDTAGAEITLRNEGFIQAGDEFVELGATQDFHFRMEEGTSLRQGANPDDGVLQFASWVQDGKVEFLGEDLRASIRVETIDGQEWAVLTVDPVPDGETFASWQNEHFTPEELENEAVSGSRADPAGDGVPNAVKFLQGIPPKVPARGALPVESVQNVDGLDYLALTFTVRNDVAASWGVEASDELGEWPDTAVEVEELRSLNESAGTTTYTYRDIVSKEEARRRFLRMWIGVNH